jgi:hypothetical protein
MSQQITHPNLITTVLTAQKICYLREIYNSIKLNIYKEIFTEIPIIRKNILLLDLLLNIQMLSIITVLVCHVLACWKNTWNRRTQACTL